MIKVHLNLERLLKKGKKGSFNRDITEIGINSSNIILVKQYKNILLSFP